MKIKIEKLLTITLCEQCWNIIRGNHEQWCGHVSIKDKPVDKKIIKDSYAPIPEWCPLEDAKEKS